MSDNWPTTEFPTPPGTPPPPPSAPARPSRRLVLSVTAAVVLALGVGIGIGVVVASGTGDDTSATAGAPSSIATGSASAGDRNGKNGTQQKGKRHTIRGTITAESGATWTIKTDQGKAVQVSVGSATKFGNKQQPADKADFPIGKMVAVIGKPGQSTGSDTIAAQRIRSPAAQGSGDKGKGAKSGRAASSGPATPSPAAS